MSVELGRELTRARESRGASLEAVAAPAKISTAYLRKLERGVVCDPSPRILARIAVALEVPYLRLMALAGYLDEPRWAEAGRHGSAATPHAPIARGLTLEEWRAVGSSIKKLVAERARSEDGSDSSSRRSRTSVGPIRKEIG
jgi:transcriptional regulator with XRE-family HTH domain